MHAARLHRIAGTVAALALPAAAVLAQGPVRDANFVPSPPTFQPRAATYLWDDGQSEAQYRAPGTSEQGALHSFTVAPGGNLITAVQVAWGRTINPRPTRICVWEDPNDDGLPNDAVLLAEFPVQVLNPDTDIFNTYTLPAPVQVSGKFFVGFITGVSNDNFPIRLDRQPNAPASRFYYLSSNTPISANTLAGVYVDWFSVGDPGYGMIRAIAASTGFTYQGELKALGAPVNAPVDLRFRLFNAVASGEQIADTTQLNAVTPDNGKFTAVLPYGDDVFNGQALWLEVQVSPAGANTFTTLTPRQEISTTPAAFYAYKANRAEFANIANAAIQAPWSGLTGVPAGFADGIDNDSGGDITAVIAGTGLTGGASSGNATLNVNFAGTGSAATVARSDHTHSATHITSDTLADARLSSNVALLDGAQIFTGVKIFSNGLNSFTGNGSGLFALHATNLASGTVPEARLSSNVALLSEAQTFFGAKTFSNAANSFTGSGAGLTNLNASNIASGTLADARLSANVALLAGAQTFSGTKTFSNAANAFAGTFTGTHIGSGSGLTGLNASNLSSGTVPDARLASNIARRDAALSSFTGTVYARGDDANAFAAFMVDRDTTGNPNLPGLRVRFDNATKLLVMPNGGTSIGSNNSTPPANGLAVNGSVSKGGGSFKIDHPLDPANKFLYHSFVESPDMMNIYNGNTTTDDRGYATVELPEWFDALNRDFRYQLTVLDDGDNDFVLARVFRKIEGRSFVIKSSQPAVEVSWQVTGVRKDAWAEQNRIPVEVDKPAGERGRYLHPEAFGLPPTRAIGAADEPARTDTPSAPR